MHKFDPTPSLHPHSRRALERLLDPIEPTVFFNDIYEERFHLIQRDDPDRYRDLLSVDVIDAYLANHVLYDGQIDVTRAEPPVSPSDFILDNNEIDRSAVLRLYQDKATIIAPHLHGHHKPLGDFVRALEPVFSASVQTNIYLTPPGAKGFKTHYDSHDVFVMQVSGAKSWRIYNEPVGKPYRGERFQPGVHDVGEPEAEFVLYPGDCVYIPRGLMHDADAHENEASLHITLGLVTRTWADLVLESISKAALETPALRRALPPGYANPGFDRRKAREQFRAYVTELAAKTELDEPLDLIAEDYLRSRAPDLSGVVRHASSAHADEPHYRAQDNALFRIVEAEPGGDFEVVTRGGSSEFLGAKRSAFDHAMSGKRFSAADLEGLSKDEALDLIRRLLSRGLIRPD